MNHCHRNEAFYTCEQVVNGKPAALVIFTLSGTAGKFDVDNVLPNGHASSDTDLLISGEHGEHWTFLTNDAPNHPTFRRGKYFYRREPHPLGDVLDGGRRKDMDQG